MYTATAEEYIHTMESSTSGVDIIEDDDWPLYVRVLIGIFVTIIGLVNIVGNICTIISFHRDIKLRTVANYYILNLAVTDLIVGLVSVPFYAVYTVLDFFWPFGYAFCKIWCVIDFWVCAESSLTIILISHDRFSMVNKGAQYLSSETKQKALIKIGITWLLSFLLYSPAIIGFNTWRGYSTIDQHDCDVEFATDFWYTLITSILEFLVPFVLITIFNSLLYADIRRRTKISHGSTEPQHKSDASKTMRRDRKAAKNLTLLVVVYFICWLPYVVSTLILAVCDTCVSDNLFEFFNWLLWFNSSLNSFMYAMTNERFRTNYRQLLCCCNITKGFMVNNKVDKLNIDDTTMTSH